MTVESTQPYSATPVRAGDHSSILAGLSWCLRPGHDAQAQSNVDQLDLEGIEAATAAWAKFQPMLANRAAVLAEERTAELRRQVLARVADLEAVT